jgi:protein O-mannosyl-transferase
MKKQKSKKSFTFIKNKRVYLFYILLVLLPIILNWKNRTYEFTTFDDSKIITNNYEFLSDINNIGKAFQKDNFISKTGENYYRPLQTVSFIIDAQISGEKSSSFYLSNLLYHILTVLVLFVLLRKLGIKNNIAFFLSLLYSIHPIFTDAIAWIPGRGDLLAGLFCSLSFLLFIYYNSNKKIWFFIGYVIAFLLALFSKETSVFLPIILLFYYWHINKGKLISPTLALFIVVWSFPIILFFILRHTFLNTHIYISLKAFIVNLQTIPILLSKLFFPLGLSPMPFYDVTYTLLGIVLFIGLIIILMKSKIKDKSIIILGIIWFCGFIIPATFVIPSFAKPHFDYLECRAYLPSIGIFILIGMILNNFVNENHLKFLTAFIIVVITFSVISYNYSEDYSDGISFVSSLIKSNPRNPVSYDERGSIYLSKNNPELALADFDNAIRLSPTNSYAYFHKGVLYNSLNNPIYAEKLFSTALNYDTLYPENNSLQVNVYLNLFVVKMKLKQYQEAIELLNNGISKYYDNSSLHNNLGQAYYYIGRYDSSLIEYSKAINLDQSNASYFNNRGLVEFHLNDFKNASIDFTKALDISPNYLIALGNRGRAKIYLYDYEGAIDDLTKAINIKNNLAVLWYFRGLAYSKLNRQSEAAGDLEVARKLGFKEP